MGIAATGTERLLYSTPEEYAQAMLLRMGQPTPFTYSPSDFAQITAPQYVVDPTVLAAQEILSRPMPGRPSVFLRGSGIMAPGTVGGVGAGVGGVGAGVGGTGLLYPRTPIFDAAAAAAAERAKAVQGAEDTSPEWNPPPAPPREPAPVVDWSSPAGATSYPVDMGNGSPGTPLGPLGATSYPVDMSNGSPGVDLGPLGATSYPVDMGNGTPGTPLGPLGGAGQVTVNDVTLGYGGGYGDDNGGAAESGMGAADAAAVADAVASVEGAGIAAASGAADGGGDGGGGGGCVIATHAVNSGAFTPREKKRAVVWCTRNLHHKWWGETIRRGYRYHGNKAIEAGRAHQYYDEFRDFIKFATGIKRTPKTARVFAWRCVQFFVTGLLVKGY